MTYHQRALKVPAFYFRLVMKTFLLLIIGLVGIYFSIPKINQHLVKHDLLIVPKNILLKKSPLVRSTSDLVVVHTKGTVYYMRKEQTYVLKKNDTLLAGDVLYVKSNGFVILLYAFDSKIKLNPNTIIKIENLKKNLDTFDHSKLNTFVLELGSVLVDYPNHSDEISMNIKTRRAAMGVRGTQFLAALGVKDQSLRVAVDHGKIELKSLIKEKHIEVSDRQGAMIDAVGKTYDPESPESNKWVKAIDWNQEEKALTTPEEYEKVHDNQEQIKAQKRQALLEQIKNFKASGDALTNDNVQEALKNAGEVLNRNAEEKKAEENGIAVADEDDIDTKVETVEFNFIKKINIGVLAKFAEKGLVPNQLKVAAEEIKGVQENNAKRIQELDKIDEEGH